MSFRLQRYLVATLMTLVLTGTATVTRTAEPTSSEDKASPISAASQFIERANKEWEAAIQTVDADALSRPYREDAVFIGPDGTPVRGRAAIHAMYTARAAAKRRIVAATIQSEGRIAVTPDDVYEWGQARCSFNLPMGRGRSSAVGISPYGIANRMASG
jgi:ketosteroid isomerase-like protein